MPDTKRKTVWVSSARIEKADVGRQVPTDNIVTHQPTSETEPVTSSATTDNISQKTENVNTEEIQKEEVPENVENAPANNETKDEVKETESETLNDLEEIEDETTFKKQLK